ncbi:MAG: class I SAM-dependent methyltransferase [Solirubrobacteraceae bacterium]
MARAVDSRLSRTARRLAFEVAIDRLGGEPARVLDAGCGDGEGLEDLRARLPLATLIGLEPEPGMAELAERRLGGDALVLREAAAPGSLETVNADLVLCHLTLALWDEPVAGLRGMAQALAPAGLLYVVDLARDALAEHAVRAALLGAARSDPERRFLEAQADASYTSAELERLCRFAGLRGAEVTVGGLGGAPIDGPVARALYTRNSRVREIVAEIEAASDLAAEGADTVAHVFWRHPS